jgi:hypothetical protein
MEYEDFNPPEKDPTLEAYLNAQSLSPMMGNTPAPTPTPAPQPMSGMERAAHFLYGSKGADKYNSYRSNAKNTK